MPMERTRVRSVASASSQQHSASRPSCDKLCIWMEVVSFVSNARVSSKMKAMMLIKHQVLSAVVTLTITEIPFASPFTAPPSNHYCSRRHLDTVYPQPHHDDSCRFIAQRNRSPRWRNVVSGRISFCASSLYSTASPGNVNDVPVVSTSERIERCKRDLIQQCNAHESGSGKKSSLIENKILELERLGVELGYGLESSLSGLLSGEW